MGWLSNLLGSGQSKENLIRTLVKKRVAGDVFADAVGATPKAVDELAPEIVISLPEATIVSIVEAWTQGRSRQIPEEHVFQFIEAHRSMAAQGKPPASPTLNSYVSYRVNLEHGHAHPPLSAAHIEHCVREARRFFEHS